MKLLNRRELSLNIWQLTWLFSVGFDIPPLTGDEGVVGSNPACPTNKIKYSPRSESIRSKPVQKPVLHVNACAGFNGVQDGTCRHVFILAPVRLRTGTAHAAVRAKTEAIRSGWKRACSQADARRGL